MGMFDYVDAPEIKCKCGAMVSGWQSKDGECLMDTVPMRTVWEYYSVCIACGAWHRFRRADPVPMPDFEHFVDGEKVTV